MDRLSFLEQFTAADWAGVDELILDITRDHPAPLMEKLAELEAVLGRARIRLRCRLCGRPRAVYRKFGICRICFRDMASDGLIPGVMKASW